MIRTAVIGVGMMGSNHARVYDELEEAELIAVCDVDEERAKEVAHRYGANWYTDHVKMLEEEDLDAVSVCVPTKYHRDVAVDVIRHGVHVLVEKPLADDLEKARDIIEAAEEQGVVLAVGHIERFNPAVQKAKEVLDRGDVGEVVVMSAKRVGPYPPRIQDVGVIVDLAVHDIDVMRYMVGSDVEEVYAAAGSAIARTREDYAEIMLRFEGDPTGLIETNWLTPYKERRLEITGTEGIIRLQYIDQELETMDEEGVKRFNVPKEEPLKLELRDFLEAVTGRKEPLVDGEAGYEVLKTALAALESVERDEPVNPEELEP